MSSYSYSLLPPDDNNIRLLRLLPNEDEAAPLCCKLCNYSLQKPDRRFHLYEALSYVWGDPHEILPIYVGENRLQLPITVNLHAALSRLRDHSFERIMWVDAICIDQGNPKERGQQVQLMAKIYSNAHRVIVWLGEEAVEIKGALEDIRLSANEEFTERSRKGINEQAIRSLLHRPWFQRIWVLQEVAAARHVVIMCGSTEIDGYAFCLGVKSLKLLYTASPEIELQALPSVIYLIERAGLRSKHTANFQEIFSIEKLPLAELVDMFHTRQATDPRDKVYALLSMSLDDPSRATLQPDYTISWEKLFKQLVNYILGEVKLVDNPSQRVRIESKGCILGQVSLVRRDDRQNVNIKFTSKNATWCYGDEIEWTLRASANSILESDIICLLQGASKPTIIRLYKDYFAIVVIAVTPLSEGRGLKRPELFQSIIRFSRDFILVWDWDPLLKESQDPDKSDNWMSLNEATITWNVALILGDLEEYQTAEKRLRDAIKGYEIAFEEQSILKSQYGLTPLS
ncbi:hypothetical protein OIDMADRAFT_21814 [Oidiodendron maius Zn]|uniref:Heterokaryon incompatibility domain-containing protein n=1 Tax=Oidiodendron maius (strain Zn) TaxID=913774 RepID=A0A0C3D6C0_OIDMZ|nr:hypothetical protein OIDMADRAFT_21814 [Oidiodendron maius Zn]